MPDAKGGPLFQPRIMEISGFELEIHEAGEGSPLLYLHAGGGFRPSHPAMLLLAKNYRVIAPSHPGFGRSDLPDWITSVDDYAHVYLELIDRLDLSGTLLIGASIGGWTAAEIATKNSSRLSRIVLIGPSGIKVGSRDQLDIPDIFAMPPAELEKRIFQNPEMFHSNFSDMSDNDLAIIARNKQTLALIAWEPYLHNPKLKHRLHMINVPTLVVRGEHDGLITPEYATAFCQRIPDSSYLEISEAGHAADIEQPLAFVAALSNWMES